MLSWGSVHLWYAGASAAALRSAPHADHPHERDKALNSLGYQVIRIDLEKENLSKFMKNSDIRKCLKKIGRAHV